LRAFKEASKKLTMRVHRPSIVRSAAFLHGALRLATGGEASPCGQQFSAWE
jgi:hypothetical protein